MKTGDIYLICPENKWTGALNEHCFVYMVARAGTAGAYRIMMLLVPKNIFDPVLSKIHEMHVFTAFGARRYNMTEGSISITTVHKSSILVGVDAVRHLHLGNIGGSLRKMRDIKV